MIRNRDESRRSGGGEGRFRATGVGRQLFPRPRVEDSAMCPGSEGPKEVGKRGAKNRGPPPRSPVRGLGGERGH